MERIRNRQIQTKRKTKPRQICRNATVLVTGLIKSIHVYEFRNDNMKVGYTDRNMPSNIC
jgi:hypothetical protein